MADVFLSYKAEDRRRIQPLIEALQAEGYSVWWDQYIATGDDWRQTIEHELDTARCVIVAWSKRSVGPEGQFVRDEATRAQRRRVYVPVTIDTVQIPLGFGESQAASLRGWKGERADPRFQAVLAAVHRVVGAPPAATPVQATRQGVDRRLVLGGGVAALAAAGIGAWAWFGRRPADGTDSIAVLPFASLSADPAQAYFAEGIAGEIRNTLTKVEGLKVAGSTSSDAVREDDAQTAARKLGVANILTGNVRQTASTIRVTTELIDGETGLTKWSQNYDREPGDVISVQSDIARNVARALSVALSASVRSAIAVGETGNIAAQTLVFQARNLSYELTVPALRQCIALLDQAIALDPDYARAYAIKSFVANNLASQSAPSPAALMQGRAEAEGHARKALALAPKLPIARSALAFAYSLTLQVAESLREHRIAVSLASGDPDVIRNFGFALTANANHAEALRYVDEAKALDPLNWASHYAHVVALANARRFAEAVSYSRRLQARSPELFRFPEVVGRSLLMLGRTEEAAAAYGDNVEGQALIAARAGRRDDALARLAQLERSAGKVRGFFSAASTNLHSVRARIEAQLGEVDGAMESLERAFEVRDSDLLALKVDPFLDPLRGSARFAALVARMNFPA
ncbi:TIR domain-containing protein [Sphingomonas astaxanthinifaciens]|uniref:TIR domain-containing protein n=1 Tax=Sphingomonas astaxanthinifaciens DSM 22298 TaxID=1123267 RepID=A0ABQ5Z644_9SPHN|nr:TIR domain-containing protein [Sphingomonas astaxanthinifaciens]GLR47477.1 hypothetical protein GCM10007925_11890 [Sphingomonas astaxanthinifaciens DSM 22298]